MKTLTQAITNTLHTCNHHRRTRNALPKRLLSHKAPNRHRVHHHAPQPPSSKARTQGVHILSPQNHSLQHNAVHLLHHLFHQPRVVVALQSDRGESLQRMLPQRQNDLLTLLRRQPIPYPSRPRLTATIQHQVKCVVAHALSDLIHQHLDPLPAAMHPC